MKFTPTEMMILEILRRIESGQIERHNQTMAALNALAGKAGNMENEIAALQTEVTNCTTVEQGAITLIQGLAATIAAAGTDPTKLASIISTLQASDTALAAAITANTPAATPPASGS